MDEIQLRMPLDRVVLVADSIERDITTGAAEENEPELRELLTWLRYRVSRWKATHP